MIPIKTIAALTLIIFVLAINPILSQTYLAYAKTQKDGWIFINQKGEMVFKPKISKLSNFSPDGLAITNSQGLNLFIKINGEILKTEIHGFKVQATFGYYAEGFIGGLAAIESDGYWGYLDTTGNVRIKLKYDDVVEFNNGHSIAEKKGEFFVLDSLGNETRINEHLKSFNHFSENLAPFANKSKRWGFLNTEGKVIIEPKFLSVGYFSNGLAWARGETKDIGYIDTTGKWVIDPIFIEAKNFDPISGLARVKQTNKSIYIDKSGKYLEISYLETGADFVDGLARGMKNKKWGFFDKEGKWVIEPKYEAVRDFSYGYAAVKLNDKWGVIDKNGNTVIEPTFLGMKDMILIKNH